MAAFVLAFLPSCLPARPPAWLSGCLPTCLPAWLPGCLAARLAACLPAWLPGCPPARLAACLPACPPGCQALVAEQVSEVSSALSWVMDHIHEHGGDPQRISLCGHSSGGWLAGGDLLTRAIMQKWSSQVDLMF